jgi:peptidoglycan/xylan/chitin deacetylase (PgdA/CDA1 family)
VSPVTRRVFLGAVTATAVTASARSPEEPAPTAGGPSTAGSVTASTPPGATSSPGPGATSASGTPSAPPTTRATGSPAADLLHGPRTRPAVALTFHGAGDPSLTRTVLRIAAEHSAGLTVLAVGSWLDGNRALATAILDGGHDLGNHTWSHLPMRRLSSAEARREVSRAAALLTSLTGSGGSWFRPSGTPRSTGTIRRAAAASGYHRCLAYDVDPLDYTDPGSALVASRVHRDAVSGSIVSLHLGHPGTVAALPVILDSLARRGLRAVTVTDLMRGPA